MVSLLFWMVSVRSPSGMSTLSSFTLVLSTGSISLVSVSEGGISWAATDANKHKERAMNRKKYRTTKTLKMTSLGLTKKFTNLRKVIANNLNIENHLRNIGFTALLIAITLLNSSSTFVAPEFKVDVVVIDAGHGGKDHGTSGKYIKEKELALKIALKLGSYIEKNVPGVKVIYTRKDDHYLPLDERADIANKNKADLFICIHANANPNNQAFGTETYVMGLHKDENNLTVAKRENSVILLDENYEERYEGFDPNSPESYILFTLTQSAYQTSSLSFAKKVEDQFRKKVGRVSRGVKQAGFLVLWQTTMPSVLIETGFLSNSTEEKFLSTDEGQDLIASGIYRAFKEYKTEVESIH
jgi:N-acetylmuramoyl-L-alanine amidase